MKTKVNPYYNPETFGLEMISFEDRNSCYDYNTQCFFATADGLIYAASDSGCSCPVPFEDSYSAYTKEEALQLMERVGSVDQALSIFDAWNAGYIPGETRSEPGDRQKLHDWLKAKLRS